VNIETIWKGWADAEQFSGVFSARGEGGALFEASAGFRNRGEALPNAVDTAFGIASGTKLFTGLTACRLIEAGKLSLTDTLRDILPYDPGQIDKRVTIFHLLTHTSGVGDYLDEESPDAGQAEQALCAKYPVYLWESLSYYLQMITPLAPKFAPGARFGYSNAGYVLLGLAIEAAAGKPYRQAVADAIITPLGLRHTGFYRADALPRNTAYGYLDDGRTNIFSLPVVGGSDGGLYTCAQDLDTLWRALLPGAFWASPCAGPFSPRRYPGAEAGATAWGCTGWTAAAKRPITPSAAISAWISSPSVSPGRASPLRRLATRSWTPSRCWTRCFNPCSARRRAVQHAPRSFGMPAPHSSFAKIQKNIFQKPLDRRFFLCYCPIVLFR